MTANLTFKWLYITTIQGIEVFLGPLLLPEYANRCPFYAFRLRQASESIGLIDTGWDNKITATL